MEMNQEELAELRREELMDRFYDEMEEYDEPRTCSNSCPFDKFSQCDLDGHEAVGWCAEIGEFVWADDDAGDCIDE